MGTARRCAYVEAKHIIDFINSHENEEATREELLQLMDMEWSLIRQWSEVLHLIGDRRNNLNNDDHTLVSVLGMAVGYT